MKDSTQLEVLIQLPFYLIVSNIAFGYPGFFFYSVLWRLFNIVALVWGKSRFLLLSYQAPFSHKREISSSGTDLKMWLRRHMGLGSVNKLIGFKRGS